MSAPGVHRLSKNLGTTSHFDTPERGNVKQAPYCGCTNIRRHRAKYSGYGDLAPGICAPLHNAVYHTTRCLYPNMEIPTCWKWNHQGNRSMQHLLFAWVYYPDSPWTELQSNSSRNCLLAPKRLRNICYIKNQQDVPLVLLFINSCKITLHVATASEVH
jgi:hypothetical protein